MTKAAVPLRVAGVSLQPHGGRDPESASDAHASFKICDGRVLVFHRADSPNWFSLWRTVEGQQVQQSLRTPDRAMAAERAANTYLEYEFRVRHGLSVQTATFGHVCGVYLAEEEQEVARTGRRAARLKDIRGRIERYLRPFFGQKAVDTITAGEIARYRDWRRTYWTIGPGSTQAELAYERGGRLVRAPLGNRRRSDGANTLPEDVVLRAIFACAAKHGWINPERIPGIETRKPKDNPRAHFTAEEAEALIDTGSAWVAAGKTDEARALRQLTVDFVELLLATGMRPSEAAKLRWGDVEFFRDANGVKNLRLWVSDDTKTGKREVVALPRGERVVYGMALARIKERRAADKWLFATPEARRVTDFGRLAKRWFAFAGMTTNPRGEARTLYSCRHTYITNALAMGLSTHLVAVNCGTSTAMIDRFYSKITASLNASLLSGRVRRGES
ncbi:tyrosine-type recombinase/integrase [Roseicella aerolata]|uniref:Tyrosine-type recombinase/integrase n=1 Tax=Roseicella aerolata TaxID=2883479 RepID=A0A9X1IDE4_9PROT|nr:tyrosine-type recombinase/integrase [Roseicella aerolata]MCB4821233.1 tyrosine-type recombinase/integrase [Roseicella aerolata]